MTTPWSISASHHAFDLDLHPLHLGYAAKNPSPPPKTLLPIPDVRSRPGSPKLPLLRDHSLPPHLDQTLSMAYPALPSHRSHPHQALRNYHRQFKSASSHQQLLHLDDRVNLPPRPLRRRLPKPANLFLPLTNRLELNERPSPSRRAKLSKRLAHRLECLRRRYQRNREMIRYCSRRMMTMSGWQGGDSRGRFRVVGLEARVWCRVRGVRVPGLRD